MGDGLLGVNGLLMVNGGSPLIKHHRSEGPPGSIQGSAAEGKSGGAGRPGIVGDGMTMLGGVQVRGGKKKNLDKVSTKKRVQH